MKKLLYISIVFAMALWSCETFNPEDGFSFYNIGGADTTNYSVDLPEIGKRGIGQSIQEESWSVRLAELDVHWYYTWGSTDAELEPEYIDFVPMVWGKDGIDDARIEALQAMKEQGNLRYLLGFNEPDLPDQSDMTVSEAVETWP